MSSSLKGLAIQPRMAGFASASPAIPTMPRASLSRASELSSERRGASRSRSEVSSSLRISIPLTQVLKNGLFGPLRSMFSRLTGGKRYLHAAEAMAPLMPPADAPAITRSTTLWFGSRSSSLRRAYHASSASNKKSMTPAPADTAPASTSPISKVSDAGAGRSSGYHCRSGLRSSSACSGIGLDGRTSLERSPSTGVPPLEQCPSIPVCHEGGEAPTRLIESESRKSSRCSTMSGDAVSVVGVDVVVEPASGRSPE